MAKRIAKTVVSPSAETNQVIREKCSRTVVDVKRVMEHFNCSRPNAVALASAAEHNLVPAKK